MGKSKELFNQIREKEAQLESVDYTQELRQFNELAPKNLSSEEKAEQFILNLQKQGKL